MKRKRSVLWASLLLVITIAVVWGAGYVYWAEVQYKFHTVTKGKVYRSAAMPPEALKKKIEKYDIFHLTRPGDNHVEGGAVTWIIF